MLLLRAEPQVYEAALATPPGRVVSRSDFVRQLSPHAIVRRQTDAGQPRPPAAPPAGTMFLLRAEPQVYEAAPATPPGRVASRSDFVGQLSQLSPHAIVRHQTDAGQPRPPAAPPAGTMFLLRAEPQVYEAALATPPDRVVSRTHFVGQLSQLSPAAIVRSVTDAGQLGTMDLL